jgi:hypothetical protein
MRVKPLQRCFSVWKTGLGFLALGASLDIFFHKFLESGSFVQLLYELPCIQDPWMASCRAIMDFSQHSLSFLDVIFKKEFSDHQFGVQKKSVIKEDTQFVSIHLLVKVLLSEKEISDGVGISRNMSQFVVEILEVFDPMCLMTGDLLGLTKVLEVLVVHMNLNCVTICRNCAHTCVYLALLCICDVCALYATDRSALTAWKRVTIYGNSCVLFV